MLTSAKLREPWYYKVYFLKLHMCVFLCVKFLEWGQGNFTTSPPRPPQDEPLKSQPKLGLKLTKLH